MKKFLKKIFVFTILTVISISYLAIPSYAQNNVTVLENGLRVLVVEDARFDLVSVRLYVHAGGAYEASDKAGISHLLEHMVFRGTKKRPDGALAKEIEAVGGDFNAYTSADETVYYTDLPSKEWRRGIDVVADMALNPVIEASVLEEEKKVVYAEMGQRRESPSMRLYEDTIKLALDGTSYMHGVLGTKESVASVTVEDIQKYMDKLYNPQNMLLVVVGNVKKDEVIAEAKVHFSQRENKEILNFPNAIELPLFNETKVLVEEYDSNKVMLNLAFPVTSAYDLQSRSLDILQIVLGGLDTSILIEKFERELKLVNTISTYNIGYNRLGLFNISVDLEVDKVDAFWAEFVKFLAQLSTKDFTQTQLETAKFLYENSFQRRKATISGYASLVGDMEFAMPGEFSISNFLHSINQVSMEDLEEAISTWIKPSNMVVTVLAPKTAVAENKLPDFLNVIQANMKNDDTMQDIIADAVYYKSYLPEDAKIIEESEKRIVIELAKGSKVILLPDSTMPFFVAELKYAGGNNLLNKNEQGLSSALASMTGLATKSMKREELSEYLASRAMSISANSTRENFNLVLDTPSQFENEAFTLFEEVIKAPSFSEKDWENIHNLLIVNAKERDEDPGSLLFSELFPTVYTDKNAYGYMSQGKADVIEKFTLEQVKKLWDKQQEQSWIFTIAGDFSLDKAMKFVSTLPLREKAIKPLQAPKMQSKKEVTYTLPNKNHEYIMQIFPTVPYENKDAAALHVLKGLLGDMSGILFKEIRDKKSLAYSVAPLEFSSASSGFLAFYVSTALENNGKILSAFEEVILDLQKNLVSQEEINRVLLSLQVGFVKSKQALGARVASASNNMYLGRSLNYEEEFFKKIEKVTPKDIQAVAKKYLLPKKSFVLKVTSN